MVVDCGKSFHIKPRIMILREEDLKLIIEQMVDFNYLEVNVYRMKELFEYQGWIPFFEMLHGLSYPNPLQDFWVKA